MKVKKKYNRPELRIIHLVGERIMTGSIEQPEPGDGNGVRKQSLWEEDYE